MNDIKRCYETLGLTLGASEEDAKTAYRDLVQVWHPDRFSHNPSLQKKAEEKLKEINSAYEAVKTRIANSSRDAAQYRANKAAYENHHRRTQKAKATSPPPPPPKGAPVIKKSLQKKYTNLILLFFILYAGWFCVMLYMQHGSKEDGETVKSMTLPEGLKITSASGSMDANQDYIVSGVIENTTDQEQPAWFVVVDVYDAQGKVLMKERMWNGKQLYTGKDYAVLAKRGMNIPELKAKTLHEPGVVIPPKGTVGFVIRFMEWPASIAGFNATLQPFNPVSLYKELYSNYILPENAER
jgi:DnaJ domain